MRANMKENTAIILLNYNGWQDTIECINSLQLLEGQRYSTFIVDNASTDDSYENIKKYVQENYLSLGYKELSIIDNPPSFQKNETQGNFIFLIKSESNGGFAAGNNIGLKIALHLGSFDYFWLLNTDTVITPKTMAPMIKAFKSNQSIGVVGSVLVYMNTDTIQAVGGVKFHYLLGRGDQLGNGAVLSDAIKYADFTDDLDYIAGASMMVNSSFIKDVGLMTEEYFLYFEELDWFFKAKKKGYSLAVALESVVYHKEGASIGTSSVQQKSLLAEYYLTRNLLLCYRNLLPIYLPFALARNLINAIRLIGRNDKKRIYVILVATLDALIGRKGRSKRML